MEARINKKRALLVSGAIILLCMCIIVGMTYALFTDTQTVTNHLKAGDMKITLKRVELTKKTLDASGYLAETQVQKATDAPVDFTNPTDENVFGLQTDDEGKVTEKIVPGSKFVAKMEISNDGSKSDVAYDYWIEIVLNVEGLSAEEIEALKLDEQLQVTVDSELENDPLPQTLDKGMNVGSEESPIGTLVLGDSDSFTVTMEFLAGIQKRAYNPASSLCVTRLVELNLQPFCRTKCGGNRYAEILVVIRLGDFHNVDPHAVALLKVTQWNTN